MKVKIVIPYKELDRGVHDVSDWLGSLLVHSKHAKRYGYPLSKVKSKRQPRKKVEKATTEE